MNQEKPFKEIFTEKEIRVIRLICRQYTDREIALKFNQSIRTIEQHRGNILKKMKARNAVGIVIYSIKNGIFKIRGINIYDPFS